MHIHDCLRLSKLRGRKTGMVGQNHLWCEPEFRFAVDMCNMHMDAWFFPGKEEQAKLAVTNNGWCHNDTVTNSKKWRTLWSQTGCSNGLSQFCHSVASIAVEMPWPNSEMDSAQQTDASFLSPLLVRLLDCTATSPMPRLSW